MHNIGILLKWCQYMILKVSKDVHTKFGEARGSRGRAINLNKNFNAKL